MRMSQTSDHVAPLYRRLPHGPNGMGREAVARNQRSRLYGGMIESVSIRGYQATTVAHVIALAGVSRRAFYELFPNKEQCFLGAHDIVVAHARKSVLDAWQAERGWINRMHAACKAMLDGAAKEPKGPHLVLVDSLGIGPRARERMQLAGLIFERIVGTALTLAPPDVCFTQLTSRAVVAGVRHIAFNRMLAGEPEQLYGLTDEVLDWIESYRTHGEVRLRTLSLVRPPHLPPAPAAFLASDDRRARVLSSVVHLTMDEGYAELTDPQIAQFAGVSTEAFHKQFASKEECFLTVLDEFVRETNDAVRPALEEAASWEEGVCNAMGAFVEHLVSHQALLRLAFIDLFEVGPAMIGRMTRSVGALTDLLTSAGPEPRRAPLIAKEAVTGAVWGIIGTYVANHRLARLPSLVDHLSYTVLAPYVGARPAIEAIQARHRSSEG
jgi:AcrR family transcriptional regulator